MFSTRDMVSHILPCVVIVEVKVEALTCPAVGAPWCDAGGVTGSESDQFVGIGQDGDIQPCLGK